MVQETKSLATMHIAVSNALHRRSNLLRRLWEKPAERYEPGYIELKDGTITVFGLGRSISAAPRIVCFGTSVLDELIFKVEHNQEMVEVCRLYHGERGLFKDTNTLLVREDGDGLQQVVIEYVLQNLLDSVAFRASPLPGYTPERIDLSMST
ncbi:hypothetical protein [Massilia sp. NR 4-1]|uniref:hypothetical protein n=1 Tax=Massilia sp. NR 4-1 TaxID=1678028 RepID=UPI00067DEA61|nr:hypothetical protein [Massilia sp. NR 4-1]AKU21881.1 hypothetical protein ACZ75_10785 [Massilia sp. NR 4-1]